MWRRPEVRPGRRGEVKPADAPTPTPWKHRRSRVPAGNRLREVNQFGARSNNRTNKPAFFSTRRFKPAGTPRQVSTKPGPCKGR